jgi:hypothetical protein
MTALGSHLRQFAVAPVCHDIQVNGQLVGLHDSGCLWWPDESTLVVADLHLERPRPMPGAASCYRPTTRP